MTKAIICLSVGAVLGILGTIVTNWFFPAPTLITSSADIDAVIEKLKPVTTSDYVTWDNRVSVWISADHSILIEAHTGDEGTSTVKGKGMTVKEAEKDLARQSEALSSALKQ